MQTAGPQREPKQRVTVSLADEAGGEGHRFGVNALASTSNAVWADGPQLITAGRDGTVRCWHLGAPQPTQTYCIDEHDDWVNDLALVPDVRVPPPPILCPGGGRKARTESGRALCVWCVRVCSGSEEALEAGGMVVTG